MKIYILGIKKYKNNPDFVLKDFKNFKNERRGWNLAH